MALLIAELCQNHNGDESLLKEMIHAAAESGADVVKMQSIFVEDLTNRSRFELGKMNGDTVEIIKRPYQLEYDRLKKLEISLEKHQWFIDQCNKYNIEPMTTIFSRRSIPEIAKLDWGRVKVASYDCASFAMLKELKENFKHIIVSTGSVYDDEIEKAALALEGSNFSFLHCVTIYPTPLEEVHLERINFLKKFTPDVGFSDHSLVERDGVKASIAALYFGASIIERHFTILGKEQTKDGPVSIRPEHLRELSDFSKMTHEDQTVYIKENVPEFDMMKGQGMRDLSDAELLNRDYYRGRFASKVGDEFIYNWEDKTV